MMLTRRSILRGLFAAPAIVSAGSIMPVRLWNPFAVYSFDLDTGSWKPILQLLAGYVGGPIEIRDALAPAPSGVPEAAIYDRTFSYGSVDGITIKWDGRAPIMHGHWHPPMIGPSSSS
jgi:hypothetical protein